MSTAVATAQSQRDLLAFRVLDEPSVTLREQMRVVEVEGLDHLRRYNIVPVEAVCAECKALLVQLDASCMSGSTAKDNPAVVHAWLIGLNAGQFKPLAEKSLEAVMLSAVLIASGDLPARCFSRDTLTVAMRQIKFISAANIDDLVRPVGEGLQQRRRALRAIVDAGARQLPNGDPAPLTPEQRATVLTGFRSAMEDVYVAAAQQTTRSASKPAQLPPIPMDHQSKIDRARNRLAAAEASGSPMVGYLREALTGLVARD